MACRGASPPLPTVAAGLRSMASRRGAQATRRRVAVDAAWSEHGADAATPAADTTTRRRYELNGKLMYPMSVAASPSVAPQILIESASYGWTEELLDAWKARYHKDIFDMQAIRAKRTAGLALTREDNNN